MRRGSRREQRKGREKGAKEMGYCCGTTWGMFTESNNSKCHHFIGFMDGCVFSSLLRSFHHSLSLFLLLPQMHYRMTSNPQKAEMGGRNNHPTLKIHINAFRAEVYYSKPCCFDAWLFMHDKNM